MVRAVVGAPSAAMCTHAWWASRLCRQRVRRERNTRTDGVTKRWRHATPTALVGEQPLSVFSPIVTGRLLIVSNRLPVTVTVEDGQAVVRRTRSP